MRAVVGHEDSSECGVVGHKLGPEHSGAVSPAWVGRAAVNPLEPGPGDLLVPRKLGAGGDETRDVPFACLRGRRSGPSRPIPKRLDPANRVERREFIPILGYERGLGAAGFTCARSLSGVNVPRCRRFCESGHSGSTSTRMSDRSQRTFTCGRPRVSASFGWRRPSAWLPTGECELMTCGASSSWFSNIMTF